MSRSRPPAGPPASPPPGRDPRFARDVAKQIDRRRLRRRLTLWTLLLVLVAAAAAYLRCGQGLGLGGLGKGDGEAGGPGGPRPLAQLRCAVRVTSSGITVDGKPRTRDEAVAACKDAGKAEVVVTGDAPHREGPALIEALKAAGITDIVVREPPARPAPRDDTGR
ncbi:MAG TPA: hypothetical protein VFT22_36225 [Kofleriaceae bacterium]|nr:hypothetical protein [Kofleriaceae bacterium]